MYTDDDFMTRRERVGDLLIRQGLGISDMPYPRTDSGDNKQNNSHNGSRNTWGLKGYPLASVYAPLQEWRDLYDYETALDRGTLFKELDLPFHGWNTAKGGTDRT